MGVCVCVCIQNWYTDGWYIGDKNRYSERQNFDVRQAYPHTKIFEELPGK